MFWGLDITLVARRCEVILMPSCRMSCSILQWLQSFSLNISCLCVFCFQFPVSVHVSHTVLQWQKLDWRVAGKVMSTAIAGVCGQSHQRGLGVEPRGPGAAFPETHRYTWHFDVWKVHISLQFCVNSFPEPPKSLDKNGINSHSHYVAVLPFPQCPYFANKCFIYPCSEPSNDTVAGLCYENACL